MRSLHCWLSILKKLHKKIKLRVGVDITPATHQKYNRTLRHLKAFLEKMYKVKNFALKFIDPKFVDQYFITREPIAKLRTIRPLNHAVFKDTFVSGNKIRALLVDPFLDLRLKSKTIFKDVLTTEDIETLMSGDLGSNSLLQVRDIFVFAAPESHKIIGSCFVFSFGRPIRLILILQGFVAERGMLITRTGLL